MFASVAHSLTASTTVVAAHTANDLAGTCFFAVTGLLAIMTFWNARRIFFQPRHAQVFNLVTAKCVEIADLLCGRSETELLIAMHFDTMGLANTHVLLDHYAALQFGFQPPDPYDRIDEFGNFKKRCTVHEKGHAIKPDGYMPDAEEPSTADVTGWDDLGTELRMPLIFVPDEMFEHERVVRALQDSILTPHKVKRALARYSDALEGMPGELMDVLNAVAPSLPETYPTLESLKDANVWSVMNAFNACRQPLEPLLDDVCRELRAYLGVERVFK